MTIDISPYILGEPVVLKANELFLDVNLEHGQVRRLDPDRKAAQIKNLSMNNPVSLLNLTVWQEPGSFPPLSLLLLNPLP